MSERSERGLMSAFTTPAPDLVTAITRRGARRWYLGGLIACFWLVSIGFALFDSTSSPAARLGGIAMLAVFGVGFLLTPAIASTVPEPFKLLPALGLLALSFTLTPFLGWGVADVWTFVGVAAAMSMPRRRQILTLVATLTVAILIFNYLDGLRGEGLLALPAVFASITLMMVSFARQITTVQQLRATQDELARLAVQQERSRVARDLHDILGHSLTVITVKAELAGRLLESDPRKAAIEIADLEDLSRGALADVRSTVAGFRGVNLAAELVNARSALEAAGIRAELPGSADAVPAPLRELLGWAIREGVTNVVRHSGASSASIRLGADFVEIVDDGTGPTDAPRTGNGLAGLRERVDAAGARLTIGRADGGGFRLRVGL